MSFSSLRAQTLLDEIEISALREMTSSVPSTMRRELPTRMAFLSDAIIATHSPSGV